MGTASLSEISAAAYQTTRCHIERYLNLHNWGCEGLRPRVMSVLWSSDLKNDTHKDGNIAFVFKAMALPGLSLFVHAAWLRVWWWAVFVPSERREVLH